jgi:hypothetical protein
MLKTDFRERRCGIAEKDYCLNGGRCSPFFDIVIYRAVLAIIASRADKRNGGKFKSPL